MHNPRVFFAEYIALIMLSLSVAAQNQTTPTSQTCNEARFETSLKAGQTYSRALGSGLVFKMSPMQMSRTEPANGGWFIQVTPEDNGNDDYAFPLNPPLRQANSQWLATGYSIPVREQLSHEHDVRFILNASEYQRIFKLTTYAAWPYKAPKPEEAGQRYFDAIEKARSGLIRLTVRRFDTSPDGTTVNWIDFSVSIVVPHDFELASDLKSRSTNCPTQVGANSKF